MLDRLEERAAPGSIFLRGSMELARTLLSGDLPISLQITLVQPGLSRAVLTVRGGNLFSAVDEFVFGGRCTRIKVPGSAKRGYIELAGFIRGFCAPSRSANTFFIVAANRGKTGLD
jgi:hypothetical protein